MEQSKRTKEMSFQRPHHAVDLVETVLEREGSSVVCVAKDESKLFIAFRLFQEVGQRNKKAGKMVLLVDDGNGRLGLLFLKYNYISFDYRPLSQKVDQFVCFIIIVHFFGKMFVKKMGGKGERVGGSCWSREKMRV